MEENYKTAKDIFFRFDGNRYFMALDGEYERYKECDISYEQELKWREEIFLTVMLEIDEEKDLEKKIGKYIRLFTMFRDFQNQGGKIKAITLQVDKDFKAFSSLNKIIIIEMFLENIYKKYPKMKIIKFVKSLMKEINISELSENLQERYERIKRE